MLGVLFQEPLIEGQTWAPRTQTLERASKSPVWISEGQERRGVPARWGDPARGIPTAKVLTVRESHEPGPPLEPGPLAPCPFRRGAEGGEGSRPEGGVPARRRVGVPARGILRPTRCQAAWEYQGKTKGQQLKGKIVS